MIIAVWRFERTNTSHESAAELYLARQLDALTEQFVMILHPVLGGHEIDALVLKRNMVFVVEFKSADGPVVGDTYGPWLAVREDGTTTLLNEGRDENPFQQVQNCYYAAKNFFEAHKTEFMTESEAAVTNFKKIKNVLIFDPEYDETVSDIRLGRDDWKLNIVGLHNEVADPFFTLRHDAINLSTEQMQCLACDILHCRLDEDFQALLHTAPSKNDTLTEKPNEEIDMISPTEDAIDVHSRETLEADFSTPDNDDIVSDLETLKTTPASVFPDIISNTVQTVKRLWGGVRDQTDQSKEAIQQRVKQTQERWRATHKVDFERLLFELRKVADSSLHDLAPDLFVANYYTVQLDAYSFDNLAQLKERYQTRAERGLYRYIVQQNYKLEPRYNRIAVRIKRNEVLKTQINVVAEYRVVPPVLRIEGPHGLSRALYAGDALSLGRGETVDCRLYNNNAQPVLSREHCMITVSDDGQTITLRDLGSTNGTFVNGEQVVVTQLKDGDTLLLGRNKKDEEGPTLHVRVLA